MKFIKKPWFLIITLVLVLPLWMIFFSCNRGHLVIGLYDGEKLIKEVSIAKNKEFEFGTLEKEGYTFLGWYSASNGGSAYTDAYGKSAGMTWKEENGLKAYAHWEANQYKITYDYCGATALNNATDLTVTYDANISAHLPVPQKEGYLFLGWFTDKTKGTQISDAAGNLMPDAMTYNSLTYPIDNNGTTLYAHWGDKVVTFSFITDGSAVEQVSYPIGTILNEMPVSIKDNYCFVSWCFDSTLLSEMSFPYTISDNLESFVSLYAKFSEGTNDILQFNTIASTKDKEYEVTYRGDAEKLIIPDSYYGKKVTKVNKISSATVKEIILPQTITEFSDSAFEGCTMLETINIPTKIKELPDNLFYGCKALSKVVIPYKVASIGKFTFSGCCEIQELNFSKNIITIGTGAFQNMTKLEKFVVESSNEKYVSIDDVLYYKIGNAMYLIKYPAAKQDDTYIIEKGTTKIGEYAFDSSSLKFIEIGGRISSIEKGAFENCKNLVNVSLSGNAVLFTIREEAFKNCSNLKALKIELANVPSLGENALMCVSETFSVYVASTLIKKYQAENNWRNIASKIYSLGTIYGNFAVEEVEGGYTIRQYFGTEKEVVVPEILNAKKIVKISENAFSFSNMEKITISKNITEIKDNAFKNCTFLKTIIMECVPPVLGDNVFYNISDDFGIYIKNTTDVLDAYRIADKWKELYSHIWSYQ